MRSSLLFGAVVGLSVFGYSYWNRPVKMDVIEQSIVSRLNQQGWTVGADDVDCPASMKWRTGQSFRCIVRTGFGDRMVTVYMQNASGEVVWQMQ